MTGTFESVFSGVKDKVALAYSQATANNSIGEKFNEI